MRVTGVSSEGRNFVVTAEDELFRFRFNMQGNALSSERKAAKAGLSLANRSAGMFLDAEIISLAISAHVNRGELGRAAITLDHQMDIVRNLAMIVPASHGGFRTGSGALDEHYHKMIANTLASAALLALKSAPMTMNGGEEAFLDRWGRYAMPKLVGGMRFALSAIAPNLQKGLNSPALIGRAEDWRERLRARAMERATAHITDLVPVMDPALRIIRGDRATSLMNVIVPRIEAQIEQVADPEERAELRARIDRLADRVAINAASKTQARLLQDVRLSLEVLEEQVEHQLPATSDEPAEEVGPPF